MLEMGVAKETARRILPMCSPTRLYMNGTIRSWIHYLDLRTLGSQALSGSTARLPTRQESSSNNNSPSSLRHFGMKPEYLRDLVPCEKCGRSAKVIDSRRVDMSQSRRRRIECQSCGHRSTRYEVSAAFYNQAIQNRQ